MNTWSHLIFEGWCTFAHNSKKTWTLFSPIVDKDGNIVYKKDGWMKLEKNGKKVKNQYYISPKERPKWCRCNNKRMKPLPECAINKCPFLELDPVMKSEWLMMEGAWEKWAKKIDGADV
jgi:hypothetical protein